MIGTGSTASSGCTTESRRARMATRLAHSWIRFRAQVPIFRRDEVPHLGALDYPAPTVSFALGRTHSASTRIRLAPDPRSAGTASRKRGPAQRSVHLASILERIGGLTILFRRYRDAPLSRFSNSMVRVAWHAMACSRLSRICRRGSIKALRLVHGDRAPG